VGKDVAFNQVILAPELAERWQVSPDATTFTFHLRRGAKFHDPPPASGREITAADVKWSYEYASRTGSLKDARLPKSQTDYMFEGLDGIDTPDPYTVVIRFKDGFTPFVTYTATKSNPIVAREVYEQDGHLKDRLVSSGPFYLDTDAGQKGTRVVFKRHPGYWEAGKPYLDEVRFLVLPDESATRAAFATKQLDADQVNSFREMEEVRKSAPDAVVHDYPSPPFKLWLNLLRPPLNDFRIRKAVSLAMDRDGFIQTIGGGKGEWALAHSEIMTDLFTQEEIKSFIKYDPEEARRLVIEAGYPSGVEVDAFLASDSEERITYVQLFQAHMRRAGINLVLQSMPFSQTSVKRRAKDFSIDMSGGGQTRADIDGWLWPATYPGGGNNYDQIDDAKVTELLRAQRREVDPQKRRELLRQVIRYVNESYLSIATFRRTYYRFTHPYVKDYYPHADTPNEGSPGIVGVWLDR